MICKKLTRAIEIYKSSNVKLIGLTVDYDPLPFSQGTITSISADKRTYTIDLHDGYPRSTDLESGKIEMFDSATDELVTSTYYGVTMTKPSLNRIVVTRPSWYDSIAREKVGDYAVVRNQPSGGIPHAIMPRYCTNCVLQGITLYSSNMFGFLETDSSNTQYINCVVDRRSPEDDFATRSHRRLRSLEADAFHSKYANIGPTYQGCIARYNGDDGIAINGDYHLIMSTNGNQLRVLGKGGATPNLAVGDPVELVTYTGERLPDAKITKIETTSPATSAEKQFITNEKFSGSAANSGNGAQGYIVTIDRSVSMPMGSVIASANRIGNGFTVKDCTVGPMRSRGILVKASNGEISGNRLIGMWMTGIKISPEYKWLEAGSGNDIRIVNNVAVGVRDTAIAVYANGGDDNWAQLGAHNNVLLKDNVVAASPLPGIAVTSTKGLQMHENIIKEPDNSLLISSNVNTWGRNEDPNRDIYLVQVETVPYDPLTDPRLGSPQTTPAPTPPSTPAPSLRGTPPPTAPPTSPVTPPPTAPSTTAPPTPSPTTKPPTPPPTPPPTLPPTPPPTLPPTPSPTTKPPTLPPTPRPTTKAPTPAPTPPVNPCAGLNRKEYKKCVANL
jgi:hypothetical protein